MSSKRAIDSPKRERDREGQRDRGRKREKKQREKQREGERENRHRDKDRDTETKTEIHNKQIPNLNPYRAFPFSITIADQRRIGVCFSI